MRGRFADLTGGAAKAWTLLAIVLLALALRLYTFRGYWGTDDAEYSLLANALSHGNFGEFVQEHYIRHYDSPASVPYRIGLIAPLALLFKVFGVSEYALVAYPLLVSTLAVLLAFACGRLLFGVNAGLIAAALWALLPEDYELATRLLPDAQASFYASLGVLSVISVRMAATKADSRRFASGLVAGLLFGLSWLVKESVFYLIPFCVVLLVLDAKTDFKSARRLWLGVAVASGGVVATEMTVYAITRGDFMMRMHEVERSFQQTTSYLFYEGSRFGWPVGGSRGDALIKRLFVDGPRTIFANVQFLFLPLSGLIAAAGALYRRDRAFFVPGLWMVTLALTYIFMTCSFASYTPLVLLNRYVHPILLPATVLTAGMIVRLLGTAGVRGRSSTRERPYLGLAVASAVALVTAYVTLSNVRGFEDTRSQLQLRKVAAFVRPADTLYTDPLSGKAFQFYWRYPPSSGLVNFEGMKGDNIRPGSFVFVDKTRLDWLQVNVSMWLTHDYGYHAPEFAAAAPKSWKVIWRNPSGTLYRAE